MSRCPLVIRDADPGDVLALRDILADVPTRDLDDRGPIAAAEAVARIAAEPDQRLLVAEQDDTVVGAVLLVRAPLTPLHSDLAVHLLHLHVSQHARRRGVGRALVEATVSWAEEKDSVHVLAAADVGSRDANRFLARLGLTQVAMVRASSVAALRSKLPVEPPAAARADGRTNRTVGQVLARRRSQRRAQARMS